MLTKYISAANNTFFKAAALSLCLLAFTYPVRAESISGTVSDKSGIGKEDVGVVYNNEKYSTQENTATDASGLYSFTDAASGLARVRVEPAADTGYAQREKYAYLTEGESLSGFDFHLIEGALIEGRLTAAHDGSHPNGILIDAVGRHFAKSGAVSGYSQDLLGDGYYKMRFAPADYYVGINGGSSEFITLPRRLTVNAISDGKTCDITLYGVPNDCVTIQGDVAINAAPHEDSAVAVLACDAGAISSLKPGNTSFMSVSKFGSEAVSCRYSVPFVPNHSYDIGFGLWNRNNEGFTSFTLIGAAEGVTVGDAPFEGPAFSFNDAGGEIAGTVTDAAGNPVLMAEVTVFDKTTGKYIAFADTNQNGEYHIYNVPAGEYLAYADHPDHQLAQAQQGVTVTESGTASGIDITLGEREALLWNKLGSDYEVAHSEIGPAGVWGGQPMYAPGKFGNAMLHQSAAQNYARFNSVLSKEDVFTIEFWLKTAYNVPDGIPGDGLYNLNPYYIISGDDHNTGFAGTVGWKMQFNASVYKGWPPYSSLYRWNTFWQADEWHHIAVVYDSAAGQGQYIKYYFDGVLKPMASAVADNSWQIEQAMDLILGCFTQPDSAPIGADAAIDNVKIYNYAKTDFSDRFTEDGGPNVAPVAKGQVIVVRQNSSAEVVLTAADINNQNLTYEIVRAPSHGAVTTPDDSNKVTYTPAEDYLGADFFTFRAYDGELYSNTAMVIIGVKNINRPPELSPIGDKAADEMKLLQFTVTAGDPDGDTIIYGTTALPYGAAFDKDTRTFSWTPGYNQAGTYKVLFGAADGKGGTDTEIVTITVNNVNRAPVPRLTLAWSGGHTAIVSAVGSYDPDIGDTISYNWSFGDGKPYAGHDATVTYTYAANQPSGSYPIYLTVVDQHGASSTVGTTVHINYKPYAKIIMLIPMIPYPLPGHEIYGFMGVGIDLDGSVTEYAWFSSRDGYFANKQAFPRKMSHGTHTIYLLVKDNEGVWSAADTRTITVR